MVLTPVLDLVGPLLLVTPVTPLQGALASLNKLAIAKAKDIT